MGLLSEGSPLSWEETRKYGDHVRKHGIEQFLNLYEKLEKRPGDSLKWGDEIEYMVLTFDDDKKIASLKLMASTLLEKLQQKEKDSPEDHPTTWRPEYASYMIEGTPGKPYGGDLSCINVVESNMKLRREELNNLLEPCDSALSITCFPRLGCPSYTQPAIKVDPAKSIISKSLFFADEAIYNDHPRFRTLTRNIRERRGEKVAINIPIYRDKNTPIPFVEKFSNEESQKAAKENHIYMDAMGFGMGSSCVQVTFQACNINEAKHLYDHLTPLCPILLALSAAAPIYRGFLSDIDCRWQVIAASVDDRTKEERGLEPLNKNKFVIPKSRYDSVDCYLSPAGEKFNDIEVVKDNEIFSYLLERGIDQQLARHISHLFIRDPISLFTEKISQDDKNDTDHFENIQSTNWQTMRFKPPPAHSTIGWRVEFRPTEVQITDFENAAYVIFVVLVTRVILSFNLNFLLPISKVDKNMQEAQKRDAVRNGYFWFRKDVRSGLDTSEPREINEEIPEYSQMSIDTIINGGIMDKDEKFPGIIPLINQYLSTIEIDTETRCNISKYLDLIRNRASGKLLTTARWIREYVDNHEDYQHDSIITEKINYDLMVKCKELNKSDITEVLEFFENKENPNILSSDQPN